MTQNTNISISMFWRFCTKILIYSFCIFAFRAITFVLIKIMTSLAPQNTRLNLSFVEDKHIVGKKMVRYGPKMTIYQLLFFKS